MSTEDRAKAPLLGIDLGTSNSVAAYLERSGVPTSLINFEGDVLTPSKLLIEDRSVAVGREAVKAAHAHAEHFAESFKRYMGEKKYPHPVAGQTWRPEVLSAMVLRRIRQDAERRLGAIGGAVITVPAFFDESRRRATLAAAEIAGCTVLDLINEPTAAAIAYAHRSGTLGTAAQVEHVLVFDLGGGTLDVTILRVVPGKEYRTVATDGEVQLGGVDWDHRLRDLLAKQFLAQTGHDPLKSAQGQVDFLQLAERAKTGLSSKETVRVPCAFGGRRAVLTVTRAEFEDLTADLLDRARTAMELVREQAGLAWPQIDRVLLCGGSTRMPMVQRMLRETTGKEPDGSLSVDEAVAQGAAIYAALRQSAEVRVVNVNSHSYRIRATRSDGTRVAHPLIEKNTPLPARAKNVFRTNSPDQDSCSIAIYDGESTDLELCTKIGQVTVRDLASDANKCWLVQVVLTCLENGKLEVVATIHDPDSPGPPLRRARATLESARGMTSEQIAEARTMLEAMTIS